MSELERGAAASVRSHLTWRPPNPVKGKESECRGEQGMSRQHSVYRLETTFSADSATATLSCCEKLSIRASKTKGQGRADPSEHGSDRKRDTVALALGLCWQSTQHSSPSKSWPHTQRGNPTPASHCLCDLMKDEPTAGKRRDAPTHSVLSAAADNSNMYCAVEYYFTTPLLRIQTLFWTVI